MDPHTQGSALVLMIIAVGVIGMLLIVLLAMTWRNYVRRQQWLDERQQRRRRKAQPLADAWESAGQRAATPEPVGGRPDPDDPPPFDDGYGHGEEDDDDDEDDLPPWRR